MTEEARREKLQQAADDLMEKVTAWMEELDLQTLGPQAIRQLCGTLKELRELCRDLEGNREQGFTVTIEGGEEAWKD